MRCCWGDEPGDVFGVSAGEAGGGAGEAGDDPQSRADTGGWHRGEQDRAGLVRGAVARRGAAEQRTRAQRQGSPEPAQLGRHRAAQRSKCGG